MTPEIEAVSGTVTQQQTEVTKPQANQVQATESEEESKMVVANDVADKAGTSIVHHTSHRLGTSG